MTQIHLTPLCGASELGANAYLLSTPRGALLLDFGVGGGRKQTWVEAMPEPRAAWVSHAHLDHLGALGALRRRFGRLPILATPATRALAGFALESVGREERLARGAQSRARALAESLETLEFGRWRWLWAPEGEQGGVRVSAWEAGHLLGAAMLLVEVHVGSGTERPFRLLYTGDFCRHPQPATPATRLPDFLNPGALDVLLCEGVLASDREADRVDVAQSWAALGAWGRQVLANPGPSLVAVSALGEAGPVLATLVGEGLRPLVHDYLGPVVRAYGLERAVRLVPQSVCREELGGRALVVASGDELAPGSPAGQLARGIWQRPGARLLLLNRVHRSSAAFSLVGLSPGEATRFQGEPGVLGAEVTHLRAPSHATRAQILATIGELCPAEVVLVHGRADALFALKRALVTDGFSGPVHVPRVGETLVWGERPQGG